MKTRYKCLLAIAFFFVFCAIIKFIVFFATPTSYYEEEGAQYETRVFNELVDHTYRTKKPVSVRPLFNSTTIRIYFGEGKENFYSTSNIFIQKNKPINAR